MSDVLSWIRLPGPFLIGHRGFAGGAVENTPEAFEAALEAGCDGVELDARLTADGILVVHHDEAATGPSGPLRIEETPWDRLASLTFQGKQGPYRISRLAEVLAGLSHRCLIDVEMKSPGPARSALAAERLAADLERAKPWESVLVSSFDPDMLAQVGRRRRSALLGFLFTSLRDYNLFEQEDFVDGLVSLHPRRDLVDRKLMKRAEERGLAVYAWTVNEAEETARLLEWGVRGIITDRPDSLEGVLRRGE